MVALSNAYTLVIELAPFRNTVPLYCWVTMETRVNVTVNETSAVQLEVSINRSIPVDPQLPRCVAVGLLNESTSVNNSDNSKLNCCAQNV